MIFKGYVVATKALMKSEGPVRFMYREEADGSDSGWRFFLGNEDEKYLSDPEHIGIYDITSILAIDPTIEEYLGNGPWVAYERDENGSFIEVHDFWPGH